MTLAEAYLLAAWKRGAPMARTDTGFPRGFWPDIARVAVEMALQETTDPDLGDFRQTARKPNPTGKSAASKAKTRAENTAALLEAIRAK